ncbi:MAG TPA: VOC family protein [Mycobacteriales bacterium]
MDEGEWVEDRSWFGAGSHGEAAAFAGDVLGLVGDGVRADLEVRGDGVRVRAGAELRDAISAAARAAGLAADPGVVQELRLRIDSAVPVAPFWRAALGYGDGDVDPWRRCPVLRFEHSDEPRPLRNRIHVDSGHPGPIAGTAAALAAAGGRELRANQWYSTVADAEGNEVDLVPGGPLDAAPDWDTLFGAMACYPGPPRRTCGLARAAAGLADDAGIPLMIDLRPEGVVLDSGKDQWEEVAGFAGLAAAVQDAARAAGLTADNSQLRFVQTVIDAVDIPAVSAFWRAVLGYVPAPNTQSTDLFDPRQLNPVVLFQPMDPAELDRRAQRNRISYELLLPGDRVRPRLEAAVAAGGTVLGDARLADPEGNEVVLRALPSTVSRP